MMAENFSEIFVRW